MRGGGEVVVDDCTMILDEGAEILVAGDDGAIVLQHRGREEEVRCMANPIHSAWRSGSLRRGGFGGGDFENGDDGGFLVAVLGPEDKGRLQASHELIIGEGKRCGGGKSVKRGSGDAFYPQRGEEGGGGPVWGRTPHRGERGGGGLVQHAHGL
jgi:hypothetical protein